MIKGFWLLAIVLGLIQAWFNRYAMLPDGISCLDMGDAILRGDWVMAVNGWWSPLYSLLLGLAMSALKPTPLWEFPVAHLVNFLIYFGTLVFFHFFLVNFMKYYQFRLASISCASFVIIPPWVWVSVGYSIFIWVSLEMITLAKVTPDMLVALFVYLASGLLLRLAVRPSGFLQYLLFGGVLGLGYLAKAAMFPMAFVWLVVSLGVSGRFLKTMTLVGVAGLAFLLVAGPYITALSLAKGRPTFGDSGQVNYAWWVNGVHNNVHWQGGPPGSGAPSHATRKISASPLVYEFSAPFLKATYPPWYDPSYWYEGVDAHFAFIGQIKVLLSSIGAWFYIFFIRLGAVIVAFLFLYLYSRRGWAVIPDLVSQWPVLIPALVAIIIYSFVLVQERYVGPFVVLFFLGIMGSLRLADSPDTDRILNCMSLALVLVMLITTIALTGKTIKDAPSADPHCRIASALKEMGVPPGEKVALIGTGGKRSYWARLARLHIVAELFEDVSSFWAAAPDVRRETLRQLTDCGARVIVSPRVPNFASTEGWRPIPNTDHFVYLVSR